MPYLSQMFLASRDFATDICDKLNGRFPLSAKGRQDLPPQQLKDMLVVDSEQLAGARRAEDDGTFAAET